jgi:cell division protein FtsL
MSALPPTTMDKEIAQSIQDQLKILAQQIYQNQEMDELRKLTIQNHKIDKLITWITIISFVFMIGGIVFNSVHLYHINQKSKTTDASLTLLNNKIDNLET